MNGIDQMLLQKVLAGPGIDTKGQQILSSLQQPTIQPGGNLVIGAPTTPNIGSINGANLTPTNTNLASNISVPTYTPPPAVPPQTTTPPLEKTASETSMQEMINRLTGINQELTGKSAFTAEQQNVQNLPKLQTMQNDLVAQLTNLQNQAQAIPLQFADYAPKSGIPEIFVQQKQQEALRANAYQALTINSNLATTQGLIQNAKLLVDQAVQARYGSLDSEYEALSKNLSLIANSPDASIQERNRANAQQDIINQKKAITDEDKQATADILNLANDAISNGVQDANIISQIQNANIGGRPNLQLAQQIYATALKQIPQAQQKLDTSIVEIGGRKLLVDLQTGNTIKDLGVSGTTPSGANIQKTLFSVGIPPSVATTKGELSKTYVDKLISAGLSPEIINGLWQNIINGNTFEEIRQGIKAQGGDPAILDTFVMTLQGIGKDKGTQGISNPWD